MKPFWEYIFNQIKADENERLAELAGAEIRERLVQIRHAIELGNDTMAINMIDELMEGV